VASVSVPGLLPPVCAEGQLLVDGAILDNVPIEAMRSMCDGTIIASDVSVSEDLSADPDVGLATGWRTLLAMRHRAKRGRKPPTIVDVLMRVSTVSSAMTVEEMSKTASLYLRPPTKDFTVVDWARVDDMIGAGYEYARPIVAGWVARQADRSGGAAGEPWRVTMSSTFSHSIFALAVRRRQTTAE
jgi:NTE family protein/lysophospholipid hydrolase